MNGKCIRQKIVLGFVACLIILCVGCDGFGIARLERGERGSALYRQAIASEQSGDVKGAIEQLSKVLIEQPRAFSAHFQLATLLQDHEEDYVGAIYHYKQYLALRPESEKSALARDRIRIAEQLLAPQILRKVGDSVQGITQAHLLQENTRLNRIITALESDKSLLVEQKANMETEVNGLKTETLRLREILSRMRVSEIKGDQVLLAKQVKRGEQAAKRSTVDVPAKKTDAKTWRALREEAAALAVESGSNAQPVVRDATPSTEEVLKKVQTRLDGKLEAVPAALKPVVTNDEFAPQVEKPMLSALNPFVKKDAKEKAGVVKQEIKTYVVQPGDTLFQISEKHYGDATHWKRIRDANRTRIDPDGRVRAGQIIVVP